MAATRAPATAGSKRAGEQWMQELANIVEAAAALTPAARAAIVGVIEAFAREDSADPAIAQQ